MTWWLVSAALAAGGSRFEVIEEALPSGDTLVVVPDDRAPVVYLRVEFPTGEYSPWVDGRDVDTAWSIQEYDPDGSLRRRADTLAVSVRLGQRQDTSWITVSCLSEDLDAALDLAADVLANRDLDTAELKRWKRGARLDWSLSKTSPGFAAGRAATGLLYDDDDPRHRTYAGPERVERDPDELLALRDAILRRPGRLIGVTGDVDLETGRRVAERLLPEPADASGDGLPAFPELRPPGERDTLEVVSLRDLTQVTLLLTRDAVDMRSDDFPAQLIAAHVLAGHAHARLGQALRYEDGSTYGVGLSGEASLTPDPLTISTSTRADNLDSAEARLLESLATFHRDGITDTERENAVTHLLGQEPFREQGPWSPMAERLWELRWGLPAGFRQAALQRASALTTDEVNGFIAEYYDPALFSRVHVVPR